ncbi:flagellar basal body P-ring formation chaperone FlgA [Sphingomonas sp. BK235]|uniref:flagellar basal body P-ring formation chaperone FlgA n=1 Tax=Sphingomonas sp. BK235 TaxID=2512131 RepID=UPI001043C832|nr:flagellar basal body P-ring formation chaperone FlgA [Sphingomonas sp. BK235]TCP37516.1 flagella basal body P-ring formation protein FlgA [Sphingomonas sp. BK235]
MTRRREAANALLVGALLVIGSAGGAAPTGREPVSRLERPVEVTVLARPVVAGAIVAAEDLRDWTAGDQPPMRGALSAPNIVGRAAARRLPAGAVVREGDLRAPQVIRRGEPVTIVLRDGALTISTSGQALNAGGLGETVRVLSDSTRRTLSGRVEAPGRVLVSS